MYRNMAAPARLHSIHGCFGFLPDLRLPLIKQWNASVEHALDEHEAVSITYAGSFGKDLIRREIGGPGTTPTTLLALATNDGDSTYESLQLQYRRRLWHGVQALASYAWSHSIDNRRQTAICIGQAPDSRSSRIALRPISTCAMFLRLDSATPFQMFGERFYLRGWAFDGIVHARTGFPINILDAEQYDGIGYENIYRPSVMAGQPLWISEPGAPGGRVINPAAFGAAPNGTQGDLGRNSLPGFGMTQLDLALRRDFPIGEHRSIELRVDAFNALNHANFADPIRFLSSPLFGESNSMLNMMLGTGSPGSGLAPLFQTGGPRSLHIAVRFRF